MFRFAPGTSVAGVFTRNRFCAAPVQVCQAHLAAGGPISALVINTGNANAGTGDEGLQKAKDTCAALGKLLGVPAAEVLPFSTGVILEPLPLDRLVAGLPAAIANLGPDHWFSAAHGIMTTDTLPKVHSSKVQIGGKTVTFTGISKGAGMIRPNMATMLSFLATDAGIAQPLLGKLAREIADASFNRITVDGDTSTNDSFIIAATGKSGVEVNAESDADYAAVRQALTAAALELAQKIVRDAEGATKFMTIRVEEAGSTEEALKVAYAVAHAAGQDRLLRLGPQPGPHPGRGGLRRHRRPGRLEHPPVAGRCAGRRQRRPQSVLPGSRRPARHEAGRDRRAHRAGPRPGQRHRLHLRLLARVRIDQRRLPFLIHPRAGADRAGAPCIETSGCVLPIARH